MFYISLLNSCFVIFFLILLKFSKIKFIELKLVKFSTQIPYHCKTVGIMTNHMIPNDLVIFFNLCFFSSLNFFRTNILNTLSRQFVISFSATSVTRSLLCSFGSAMSPWFFVTTVVLQWCLCIWRSSHLLQTWSTNFSKERPLHLGWSTLECAVALGLVAQGATVGVCGGWMAMLIR